LTKITLHLTGDDLRDQPVGIPKVVARFLVNEHQILLISTVEALLKLSIALDVLCFHGVQRGAEQALER
jgi:hypothetical protein